MDLPGGDAPQPADLRSRNLSRNRAEAAAVALDLFRAHGYDAVTVEDIARAAGISRRTFFRYFESKEGAVLPFEAERLDLLRHALAERVDEGEPLLATVRRATLATVGDLLGPERADALARLRIAQGNPAVHAWSLEIQYRWEEAVRTVVAHHLGVDPATSVTARVVAGASVAAIRAAAEVWLATDGHDDLERLVTEAYDVLTTGLTGPGR